VLPDRVDIILLIDRLRTDRAFAFGNLDALVAEFLDPQGFTAGYDADRAAEFLPTNRRAVDGGALEFFKKLFPLVDAVALAFEIDPVIAGADAQTEEIFDEPEIFGFVAVKRLREAGVVEMDGLAGHAGLENSPHATT